MMKIPPGKTFEPIERRTLRVNGAEVIRIEGWLIPGDLDPYSEPYRISVPLEFVQ